MKKSFFILFILFFSINVTAVTVDKLNIDAQVDAEGFAEITETYFLRFDTPFEKNAFYETAIENSSSIYAWSSENDFFFPHFEPSIDKLASSSISFDNQAEKIIFTYTIKKRFATLITEGQRADSFTIDDKQLFSFNDSGTIVIPENTTIKLILPPNTEFEEIELPEKAQLIGNTLTLNGIQSNVIKLKYKVLKPIAPNTTDFLELIMGFNSILLPLLIALLILIYFKKEKIEEKIEGYLIDHSEIKNRQPEEINFEIDSEI